MVVMVVVVVVVTVVVVMVMVEMVMVTVVLALLFRRSLLMMCVSFPFSRSFYPSTISTPSFLDDSSILEMMLTLGIYPL